MLWAPCLQECWLPVPLLMAEVTVPRDLAAPSRQQGVCGPPRPLCDWGGEGVRPPVRDALESVGVRASHLHLIFHPDSERRPRRTLRRLP